MIKFLYIVLGIFFLVLGTLGIFLPILPTTPFLLLIAYFFAKGSKKFHLWFTQTKLYKNHLESFIVNRSMTRKQKWRLMIFVDSILLISFIMVDHLFARIFLVLILIIKHIYFHTQVKIIN